MENTEKKDLNLRRTIYTVLAELIIYGLIFFTIPGVNPTAGTKFFLFIISVCSPVICSVVKAGGGMHKYKSAGYKAAIVFVSVYASLASFSQRYFFEEHSRMHLSGEGLLCCILAVLWFIPVVSALLGIMEILSRSPEKNEKRKINHLRYFVTVFLIYSVWQGIVFMAFRPGGFPPDSISQLFQAVGYEKIHDWHPALHTLLFRLILKLTGNRAMFIVAAQMLAFTALTAGFVAVFVRWGANKYIAAVVGLVFLMLPNNVLSEICAVKDFPYTLSLLWATLLLLKLISCLREEKSKGTAFVLAELSLAIFLIFGFRHNGIVPAVFIIVLLIALSVKYFGIVRFKAIAAAIAAVVMMVIYKGPVFKIFDVYPNTASPYTTMLCAVGSCINQGMPLSDEATEIMESVIPLEDWAKYYSKYEGHDKYNWGRGEDEVFNTEHITARDAFRVYLEALVKYPDVVIKDRLNGTDIMWDIPCPKDGFNEKSYDTIYFLPYSELFFNTTGMEEKGYGQYAFHSELADFYRDFTKTRWASGLDMLLWRSGSYLVLMLTALIYISANNKKYILYAAVPLGGNIFGWLILLYHQSFRYVYALQPMIISIVLAAILTKPDTKERYEKISYERN